MDRTIIIISFVAMAIPAVASAQEEVDIIPGEFGGNVGIVSDYTFRGISQTNEKPAIQGGIDWSHDTGVHLSVWGSNVDFNEQPSAGLSSKRASAEIDVVGGWGRSIGAFSYDIAVIAYLYPGAKPFSPAGAPATSRYDFVEGVLTLGYQPMDNVEIGILYAYSPDFFYESGTSHYAEASAGATFELGLPVSLGMTAGHQAIAENARFGTPDYWNWSTTLSVNVSGMDIGVSYRDTSLSSTECFGGSDWCDARAVAFVSYGF